MLEQIITMLAKALYFEGVDFFKLIINFFKKKSFKEYHQSAKQIGFRLITISGKEFIWRGLQHFLKSKF